MDNVKVFLRKRPLCPLGDNWDILTREGDSVKLEDHRPCIKKKQKHKKFRLKRGLHFWSETETNQSIYDSSMKTDISQFLNGSCRGLLVLTYGQTGSGKTHTIMGKGRELGLLHHYFVQLFQEKKSSSQVFLSGFEIYNEKVSDLLHCKQCLKPWASILTHKARERVQGLGDVNRHIDTINNNKIMGKTKINDNSSRSHTIYKIDVDNRSIIFIDLAGTERGKLSIANNRKEMQEGNAINMSLFSLKECIRALRERKTHIPFRRSRLTIVLRDIFQQHFDIRFIATLNPSSKQFHDTLDTIRYAVSLSVSDLKQIELNETVKVEELPRKPPIVPKLPLRKVQPGVELRIQRKERQVRQNIPHTDRQSRKDIQRAREVRPLSSERKSSYRAKTPLDLSRPSASKFRSSSHAREFLAERPTSKPETQQEADMEVQFTGYMNHYYNYILNLHKCIRQDHKLFEKFKKESLTDKNACKSILALVKKKRQLMKDLAQDLQPYLLHNNKDNVQIYPISQEQPEQVNVLPAVTHRSHRVTGGRI